MKMEGCSTNYGMPKVKRKPRPKKPKEIERSNPTPMGYEEDGFCGYSRADDEQNRSVVGEDAALNLSAVYASIDLYCRSIKSFPLITYRDNPEGGRERASDHSAYSILKDQPNNLTSAVTFWALAVRKLLTKGNFFAEIVRLEDGVTLDSLHYIPNETIKQLTEYVIDSDTGRTVKNVYYEVTVIDPANPKQTEKIRVEKEKILHLHINSENETSGVSVLEYAAQSLGIAEKFQEATKSACRNITMPSIQINSPNAVDPKKRKTIRESFEKEISGSPNVGKLMILDLGSTASKLSLNEADYAFLEQRRYEDEIIARWFGLSPSMIGDTTNSHYASLNMDNQYLIQRALAPLCEEITCQINRQLFGGEDVYCEFLLDVLLKGMTLERYQAHAIGLQSKFLTVDEVRQMENRPPMPIPEIPVPMLGSAAPGQVDFNTKELDTENSNEEANGNNS